MKTPTARRIRPREQGGTSSFLRLQQKHRQEGNNNNAQCSKRMAGQLVRGAETDAPAFSLGHSLRFGRSRKVSESLPIAVPHHNDTASTIRADGQCANRRETMFDDVQVIHRDDDANDSDCNVRIGIKAVTK